MGEQRPDDLSGKTEAALRERLEELRPGYEEYLDLHRMLEAFEFASIAAFTALGHGPGQTMPGKSPSAQARREQTLAIIRENPGIGVRELAQLMSLTPDYLYRVTARLRHEGLVIREGRGLRARRPS